ncbi:tyrosine--tRNA ligase [Anaerolineae bacterium]|nr:tyrosine--tRNA ligase [Anaerolineaceae bacterium]GDX67951.1 tyrosine--tRNA ligase [Anaerolineae bacterium]
MKAIDVEAQLQVLMQGTEYGDAQLAAKMRAELRERLLLGRPLRVYCGYDPTATDLHLGHTITMRKLRQFQELGHEVTFLIGSYTALVGDPSDKNRARPVLTEEQVNENARSYSEQAFRVLDREKTVVRANGEWLSKLSLVELIRLAQNFTVQQFLVRDNFAKRMQNGDPIFLHETFYALMQGYDACAMQTDVQVGGTDQLFNIIVAGRKLQEALGQRPQVGIITGILPGTDGVLRMSKSTGNHIPVATTAEDMYGKLMSVPDAALNVYMRLVTRWSPAAVQRMEEQLASGALHPRDGKMQLAHEITEVFYGADGAAQGQAHFERVFQRRELPDDMPVLAVVAGTKLVDFVVAEGLVPTKSEARRLIKQGGIKLGGVAVADTEMLLQLGEATVIQVGKRKFARLMP